MQLATQHNLMDDSEHSEKSNDFYDKMLVVEEGRIKCSSTDMGGSTFTSPPPSFSSILLRLVPLREKYNLRE